MKPGTSGRDVLCAGCHAQELGHGELQPPALPATPRGPVRLPRRPLSIEDWVEGVLASEEGVE